MNWILILVISGIAFWLMWLVIGLFWLYDHLETEYFVWSQKRMWKNHYRKEFGHDLKVTKS